MLLPQMMKSMGGAGGMPSFGGPSGAEGDDEPEGDDSDDEGPPPLEEAEPKA